MHTYIQTSLHIALLLPYLKSDYLTYCNPSCCPLNNRWPLADVCHIDFVGVTTNLHISPTGKNLYVGGSGGITLAGSGDNYRQIVPGYSWYWLCMLLEVKVLVADNLLYIGQSYNASQWRSHDR